MIFCIKLQKLHQRKVRKIGTLRMLRQIAMIKSFNSSPVTPTSNKVRRDNGAVQVAQRAGADGGHRNPRSEGCGAVREGY